MPADQPDDAGRHDRAWAIGIAVAVALLIAVVLVAMRGDRSENTADAPPASDRATGAPTGAATDPSPATTAPSPPTPTSDATAGEPAADPGAAQPTDDDIAAFMEAYGPAQHMATGDVDGDGLTDVVAASSRDDTTRIDVGFWDGSMFHHETDEGGPAQLVDALTVQDYNGVPGAEIVTEQSVGEAGRSLSVWGGERGRLVRHNGEGGCWDGFHTYGISGATIEPGRITATCDGSPLPPEAWSSDVYEWDENAWVYTESIAPEQ